MSFIIMFLLSNYIINLIYKIIYLYYYDGQRVTTLLTILFYCKIEKLIINDIFSCLFLKILNYICNTIQSSYNIIKLLKLFFIENRSKI